jgi:Zn-dependent protease
VPATFIAQGWQYQKESYVSDLTLQLVLLRSIGLLVIAAVHGVAIGGAATALGDPGVKYDGRLTISPLPHLDLAGSFGVVIFALGWIRQVAVEPSKLRFGRAGLMFVALAGLAANIVLCIVLERLKRPLLELLPGTLGLAGVAMLEVAASLSLWFAIFNTIPLPPMTGSLFFRAAIPGVGPFFDRHRIVFLIAAAAFVVTGFAERFLTPFERVLASVVLTQ